ncbi:MAG: hypothetical protein E7610_00015 [Ruminococcaceae bacterium]|nr:hypothetical protein [Oscillospiraceae bacterium]
MGTYTDILNHAREETSLHDKSQCLTYLGRALSASKKKIAPADREELAIFAVSEMENVPALLDNAANYREKDEIFGLVESLMNLVMISFDSPAAVPADKLEMLRGVVERCDRERFLERAIDECFEGKPDASDMERILCMAAPLKDEFHKGQLWQGLLHYKGQVRVLNRDAKAVLVRYAVSELNRYAEERANGTITKDGYNNLEFICDTARDILDDTSADSELVALIAALFDLNDPAVSYYALSTLLAVGKTVPDGVISALAENLEYADRVYHVLKQYGMAGRFPAELCDPIYLAKSDLVQWLTYPTELGKQPDEIEYLGQAKKKGEIYHIFRYKSDSDNLDKESKGIWLIGWANDEGGTFSNFDKYADFEQKTPEKTVKYIRRKLL